MFSMSKILNLGVLAHVDAGKTSLTERILYTGGAISSLGSVDTGNTQTDTLSLEQQRGITIRAAVASLCYHDCHINLIDTPGHPDFIAEVERSLSVLDAVILVVSSVEGVQPQTRRLARAIKTTGLPCIIFCNKIDRAGARETSLLADIESKLGWQVLPLNRTVDAGTPGAHISPRNLVDDEELLTILADHDDVLLEQWLEPGSTLSAADVTSALQRTTLSGGLVPVMFGSALTGVGAEELLALLPGFVPEPAGSGVDVSAQVFKIERDRKGERIVLARVWTGELCSRMEYPVHREGSTMEREGGKITRLERCIPGGTEIVGTAGAGQIVRAHGLHTVQVGDCIGQPPPHQLARFCSPVFETVVREREPDQRHALHQALQDLADQDPFISVRLDPRGGTISIRLFGEVQREVIEHALVNDFGVPVDFEESTVIYIERPVGAGESIEHIGGNHPFVAGVGLRVSAGAPGVGVHYHRSKESLGKTRPAFYLAIEETVIAVLAEGLYGWEVKDIDVELTHVEFVDSMSTAGDFRGLTPLVLMAALKQAGTEVCEPVQQFRLELPEDRLTDGVRHLVQGQAVIADSTIQGDIAIVTGEIPAANVPALERQLPGFSRGEGDLDYWHHGWQRVTGDVPSRPRTDFYPLDRTEYLSRWSGRM